MIVYYVASSKHIRTCLDSLSRGALIMNAASLPPAPDRQSPPPWRVVPDEDMRDVPPPGARRRDLWHSVTRWIQENTFAPDWLPERLRRPLVTYVAAALTEVAAASLILLLLYLF